MSTQAPPVYIVSVNNTPDVAKKLVALLIEDLKSEYNLVYAANTETIEGLRPLLHNLVIVPQVLICSSQWTVTQGEQVFEIGKAVIPDIKTVVIPSGLNATKGGNAVVDFLKEQFIALGLPRRSKVT